MKKVLSLLLSTALIVSSLFCLFACGGSSESGDNVLHIYNWEDYISETDENGEGYDVIAEFEKYYQNKYNKAVTVEYSTFGTNENMYNELTINSEGSYDLICPSDYMIMKLIQENKLEKFTNDFINNSNYTNNVSPYIKQLFADNDWTEYAACYMWGTLGLVYNPEYIYDYCDMSSWSALWSVMYDNQSTIKDSVRDTYFLGLAYVYSGELKDAAARFEAGTITAQEYNDEITEILNRTSTADAEKVSVALKALKENIYGFEVDSGKNDMVSGKINVNFCWSGDGAYAIYEADDLYGTELKYSVPEEGSNIWFDGWVMPKGANVPLAEEFLNFISQPEVAIANMEYIGYTSSIATDEVYDWVVESYSANSEDEGYADADKMNYDLSYFFGAGKVFEIYSDDADGMLLAQYPTEPIITRCAVMKCFDDTANTTINTIWESIKGTEIGAWVWIVIGAVVAVIVVGLLVFKFKDKLFAKSGKKGYTVVKKG